ncbi:MAG: DUF294 nucleotidyltransferase-like domain-containing protein [Hyphomicrobiaceae bacterium]
MSTDVHAVQLIAVDAVALDTETTGLDARNARLVQVGAIRIRGGALVETDTLETLIDPGIAIPPATIAVHGITDAMVKGAPRFVEAWRRLSPFLGPSVLVGHTLSYDIAVIERELADAGLRWKRPRVLDIRHLAQIALPTLNGHTLDNICEVLGVTITGRHTASGDARAAAEAFIRLVPLLRERDIRTVGEANLALKTLREREARSAGGLTAAAPGTVDDTEPSAEVVHRIDSSAYRHRVRDVMSTPPHWASAKATLAELVRQLMREKISSALIANEDGRIGIVTERDALRAIAEQGNAALDLPIAGIQSVPIGTVWQDAFLYRAIGRMQRLGYRHLGVTDDYGNIVGAVTARNLLAGRTAAPMMLGDEIQSADDAPALAVAWSKISTVARRMVADGVDARTTAAVISEEIRLLTRRCAELAEARMGKEGLGPPPCAFCLLLLGSGGRGESLLAADQDNAIVFAQGAPGGPEDQWFERFAMILNALLDAAGVPFCKGGIMARNAEWRKSVDDWRRTIDGWIVKQSPQDLLNVDIFYDAMPVYGDRAFGREIWAYAYDKGGAARDFVNLLTEQARVKAPALTLFGSLKQDDSGRLDLKMTGLFSIVAAARVLSIKHGIKERPTLARWQGLTARKIGSESDVERIIDAHETLLGFIITQQLADIAKGVTPSPRVDVRALSAGQKTKLKAALGAVSTAVDIAGEGRL